MPPPNIIQPAPGDWTLPLVQYAGASALEPGNLVALMFAAKDERPGEMGELSVRVPIPRADVAAMIARLQALLDQAPARADA
jgi:hypothetical protein